MIGTTLAASQPGECQFGYLLSQCSCLMMQAVF
jgi:hypothetical protein